VHTEDAFFGIRTASMVSSSTFAIAQTTITAVAAGSMNVLFTAAPGALQPTALITTPILATDTIATTALKFANAVRTSPLGAFYNVTVNSPNVLLTARNPGSQFNIASTTQSGGTVTFTGGATPATNDANRITPGLLVSYDAASYNNQDQNSIVRTVRFASPATFAGIVIYSPELWVNDDNSLVYPNEYPYPLLTHGVVSLELAPGSAPVAQGGASLFASTSGVNQGRIAASAIDVTFTQINLPGQPFTLRPITGRTTHGGSTTQKFRLVSEQ
jgi:hypothetical protein